MGGKKFSIVFNLKNKETHKYDSKDGDSVSVDDKQITLKVKGALKSMLDTVRFDSVSVDDKKHKTSNYTYARDNDGNSVYRFRVVNG